MPEMAVEPTKESRAVFGGASGRTATLLGRDFLAGLTLAEGRSFSEEATGAGDREAGRQPCPESEESLERQREEAVVGSSETLVVREDTAA